MIAYCQDHEKKHKAYQWKSWIEDGNIIYVCRERLLSKSISAKKSDRVKHWKEIKTRVRTQDGELVAGGKANKYRQKYFGLSKPVDFNHPIYQKELSKTQ